MGAGRLLVAPAPWRDVYPESSWEVVMINIFEFLGICWDLLGFVGLCWDFLTGCTCTVSLPEKWLSLAKPMISQFRPNFWISVRWIFLRRALWCITTYDAHLWCITMMHNKERCTQRLPTKWFWVTTLRQSLRNNFETEFADKKQEGIGMIFTHWSQILSNLIWLKSQWTDYHIRCLLCDRDIGHPPPLWQTLPH